MQKTIFTLTFGFISLFAFNTNTVMANPKLILQQGKWAAYEYKEGKSKVCYMIASPAKEEGQYSKRGKVYLMITHRPPESFNVVSFHQGYGFAPGATVDIKVDQVKFELFTEDETAWASNDQDGKIVDAIKRGNKIVVHGKSSRGTETTDTYSLTGSTNVYKAMTKACGGIK